MSWNYTKIVSLENISCQALQPIQPFGEGLKMEISYLKLNDL